MIHQCLPLFRALRCGLSATVFLALFGCGPSYSPDTYSSSAVQQANKVERGLIVGVRRVDVSAPGTVGALAGAAAGGAVGAQVPGSMLGATFGAIGGTVLGGLVGTTVEHTTADTTAFEYIVRKPNGDMVSVTQKDKEALPLGQRVLVIAGSQARIVPDYTLPEPEPTPAAAPAPPTGPIVATPLPAPDKPGDAAPFAPIPLPAAPRDLAPSSFRPSLVPAIAAEAAKI